MLILIFRARIRFEFVYIRLTNLRKREYNKYAMEWLNFYGLIFLILIMLPNIVFAATHKAGFENSYRNKYAEIFEQIGRAGCFSFIFIQLPPLVKGYYFRGAMIFYLAVGGALTLTYLAGWVLLWKENSVRKSLLLSIVPSALFLSCGAFTLNYPLLVSAAIFAPCHILISYKNAKKGKK